MGMRDREERLQMFEFKKYLGRHGLDQIHVQDLILFSSLRRKRSAEATHNCLGSDASFERVLNVLGRSHDLTATEIASTRIRCG